MFRTLMKITTERISTEVICIVFCNYIQMENTVVKHTFKFPEQK